MLERCFENKELLQNGKYSDASQVLAISKLERASKWPLISRPAKNSGTAREPEAQGAQGVQDGTMAETAESFEIAPPSGSAGLFPDRARYLNSLIAADASKASQQPVISNSTELVSDVRSTETQPSATQQRHIQSYC